MNCPTCDIEYKDDVPHPPAVCADHAGAEMKKVRLALEGALETICKKDKAVEEALENRDEAWFATLLNNHILDVEDSNIYDEVKRRYESP